MQLFLLNSIQYEKMLNYHCKTSKKLYYFVENSVRIEPSYLKKNATKSRK
jgi:hypothetical protein